MGFLSKLYHGVTAGASAGLGAAGDAWDSFSGGKEKRKGYNDAANAYGAYGQAQKDWYGQGLNKEMGAWGQAQDVYNRSAPQLQGPGYAEQFYTDNQGGRQGALKYTMDTAARANADAMAARGINNSTVAGEYENRARQGLLSDYTQHEGQLASAADEAKMGRLRQLFGEQFGIAGGEAGSIGQSYGQAGQAMSDAQKNQIAARLAASGVKQEEINQLLALISTGAKAYAA